MSNPAKKTRTKTRKGHLKLTPRRKAAARRRAGDTPLPPDDDIFLKA